MHDGERFNAVTHLVGAVLAVGGTVLLVVKAASAGDPWKLVSVSIYGATLVVLYCASALYHGLQGRAKNVLRELDHQSIYLLIAGSYTPFCLVTLRGPWGWSLFGTVWGLALFGILQDLRPNSGARILSVVIYVVMGWVIVVALVPLLQALGPGGFALLLAGGSSTRPESSSTPSMPGSGMHTVSGICSCSPAVPPITSRSCTTFCERPARRSAGHQPIAGRQASISVGGCRPTGARAGGGASL